jgi:hypothetical protein
METMKSLYSVMRKTNVGMLYLHVHVGETVSELWPLTSLLFIFRYI